jgi:hypothetical protein
MISLRRSIAWRLTIYNRLWRRLFHLGAAPLAALFPKQSVTAVLCGRNDGYTPDFLNRVRTCLAWAFRHGLTGAVWVEWNPPVGVPLLARELTRCFPRLRAYEVPGSVHEQACQNPAFGLMEYHAKNVGIRKARTDWVCCTNADIIWGPDTFPWFSALRRGKVYQTRRIDFDWTGENISTRLLVQRQRYRRVYRDDCVPLDGAGDFTLATAEMWHQAQGYDESLRSHRFNCDSRGVLQLIAHGAELVRIGTVFHMDHGNSSANGWRPTNGQRFDYRAGLPYKNNDDWGLAAAREVEIGDRIWRLEPALP